MFKLGVSLFLVWLVIFIFRIIQIGGIDVTYRDSGFELFKPQREYLSTLIKNSFSTPSSELLSGMLLGEKSSLPYFLKKDLERTSTIHMVVVSGQNLSILGGFLMSLAPLMGRRPAIFITLIGITLYSLLTGFQTPVIRSLIMAALTFSAQLLGKEIKGGWALTVTALGLLLINPNWLISLSFQLSVLATFGVVVVAPILSERFFAKFPSILRQDLAVAIAAQVMTAPIIAINFNQISLVGILANLLVGWTMPFVMISGFLFLAVGLVSSLLGGVVALIPAILLTYFVYIVEFLADLPFSSLTVGKLNFLVGAGYYLILIGFLINMKRVKPITKEF